jgi:hypothetical protein
MTGVRWLSEHEDHAWRGLMMMHDSLSEFVERQLRRRFGISNADYLVLAHISESPGGRLRSFELGNFLRWEKSRLSQHLGRMRQPPARGWLPRGCHDQGERKATFPASG